MESYLLGEDWEIQRFRERFAGTRTVAALDAQPVFIYEGGGEAELFNLSPESSLPVRYGRIHETFRNLRCVEPATPPQLSFR